MQVTRRNKKLTYALIVAAIIAVMGLVGISVAGAQGGGACHGTYYVDININGGDGSYALWTFNQDGTFQGADSTEEDGDENFFGHQQGAWQHTVARDAKATWLDFSYFNEPPLVARVDAELTFSDGCQSLDGTLDLRFYNLGDYPFDPSAVAPFLTGSFNGGRVNP